jgi:DNA-binding IclR family transcriptional regulator
MRWHNPTMTSLQALAADLDEQLNDTILPVAEPNRQLEKTRQTTGKEIHSGVGVLDKTVKILDALESGPSTLGQLVAATGFARPTAHRLAIALERHRFVLRDQHGRFVLGSRFAELAAAAGEDRLLTAAGPILQTLLERSGESAQIFRRQGDQRVCIAAVERASGLRDSIPVGAMLSMEAGSAAQILIAWEDPERMHQGLRHAKYTASRLAAVRKRGWAESINEREEGVCSISAPIRNASGHVIAAISISGPSGRMGQAPGRRYAPLVMAAGRYLTDALVKASSTR